MQDNFHHQLFDACEQISPYLAGSVSQTDNNMLRFDASNQAFFQQLYSQLQQQNPEADKAYWLTRSWSLATWQPIYIAFISIYGFNTLPNFFHFAQSQAGPMVTGFNFSCTSHQHGNMAELVPQAAAQLKPLFEQYRHELDSQFRCRPGFVNALLVDSLIKCGLRLRQFKPELSLDDVKQNAGLWLVSMELPLTQISKITERNQALFYTRKSCCLVYKTQEGSLCEDCPRQNSK